MCLEIKSIDPNKLNKKFKNGKVILYKAVKINRPWKNPYLTTPFQDVKIKAGFFRAKYPCPQKYMKFRTAITSGAIHVYTNQKYALNMVDTEYSEVIIPVICYQKDFLAVGKYSDACFTKIFIRKKDYEKALKATSKSSVIGR